MLCVLWIVDCRLQIDLRLRNLYVGDNLALQGHRNFYIASHACLLTELDVVTMK